MIKLFYSTRSFVKDKTFKALKQHYHFFENILKRGLSSRLGGQHDGHDADAIALKWNSF